MNTLQKIAIIGAGVSGISTAKIFKERGIPFDWYEKGSVPGGLWNCDNDNELTRAYDTLSVNLTKNSFAFADYPFPKDTPLFPNHKQIMSYLRGIMEKSGLSSLIKYNHCLQHIEWDEENKKWLLTIKDEVIPYDRVILAAGSFNIPKYPSWSNACSVPSIHSQQYKEPSIFKDKRVLLVGIGSSAHDIALDAFPVAKEVAIMVRKGAALVPKIMWNLIPVDAFQKLNDILIRYDLPPVPHHWLVPGIRMVFKMYYGDQFSNYKVPHAKTPVLVSDEFMALLKSGKIKVFPDLKEFSGKQFHFVDGSSFEPDIIVFCTGYTRDYPFLAGSKTISIKDFAPTNLFLEISPLNQNNLYCIGFGNAVGSHARLVEKQADYVADLILGKFKEPSLDTKKEIVAENWKGLQEGYALNEITKHLVLFHDYAHLLSKIKRGKIS